MNSTKYKLNIPGMENSSSLVENVSELKEKVNQLQHAKHQKRLKFNGILNKDQDIINSYIKDIEDIELKDKIKK